MLFQFAIKAAFVLLAAVVVSLTVGLLVGLTVSLLIGLAIGLIVGLLVGLTISLLIRLTVAALIVALVVGLVIALIVDLIVRLIVGHDFTLPFDLFRNCICIMAADGGVYVCDQKIIRKILLFYLGLLFGINFSRKKQAEKLMGAGVIAKGVVVI